MPRTSTRHLLDSTRQASVSASVGRTYPGPPIGGNVSLLVEGVPPAVRDAVGVGDVFRAQERRQFADGPGHGARRFVGHGRVRLGMDGVDHQAALLAVHRGSMRPIRRSPCRMGST